MESYRIYKLDTYLKAVATISTHLNYPYNIISTSNLYSKRNVHKQREREKENINILTTILFHYNKNKLIE